MGWVSICEIIQLKPRWRNWQTRGSQKPMRIKPRAGSIPALGTMEYLLILLFVFLLSLYLERKYQIHLYRNRKERLMLVTIFFVIGSTWDSYAVWRGHWFFPNTNTVGITIGLLPLEEYLFFLIIPYFILTTYKVVDQKFQGWEFIHHLFTKK